MSDENDPSEDVVNRVADLIEIVSDSDVAAEVYSESVETRQFVKAIPLVGGYLDDLFTTRASKINDERLTRLMEDLKSEFSALSASSVRKEFLSSSDFDHLVLETIRRSVRCRSKEKIKRFAGLLAGASCQIFKAEHLEASHDLLGALTDSEFMVCQRLVNFQKATHDSLSPDELKRLNDLGSAVNYYDLAAEMSWPPKRVRSHLAVATSKGALYEVSGSFLNYSGGAYHPLPVLLDLLSLLPESEETSQ